MSNKLSLKDVHVFTKGKNIECISTEYISTGSKLTWRCNNGHIFDRSFYQIRQYQNCPYCSNTARLSLDLLQEIARHNDGKLLSTDLAPHKAHLNQVCCHIKILIRGLLLHVLKGMFGIHFHAIFLKGVGVLNALVKIKRGVINE